MARFGARRAAPAGRVPPKTSVPIVIRPIREQFEHDRVIRQLQSRYKKRRYTVAINPGNTEETSIKTGVQVLYPDLLLTRTEGGRRHHDVVEVETGESINHLEALAEWAHLAKVRGAFFLYVPAGYADLARRLCEEKKIRYTEIWTYYAIGGEIAYTMAFRSAAAARAVKNAKIAKTARAATPKAKTKAVKKKAAKPAKKAKAAKKAKPVKKRAAKAAKNAKKKSSKKARPAKRKRKSGR